MSSNLVWQPESKPAGSFSDSFKRIVLKRHDLGGDGRIFDHGDISYLQGLEDAGYDEASQLISLIGEHDQVRLKLEY